MATTDRVASQDLSAVQFGLARVLKEGKLKGKLLEPAITQQPREKRPRTSSLVRAPWLQCRYSSMYDGLSGRPMLCVWPFAAWPTPLAGIA